MISRVSPHITIHHCACLVTSVSLSSKNKPVVIKQASSPAANKAPNAVPSHLQFFTMAQQHLARTSKTPALITMDTVNGPPACPADEDQLPRLCIRIPKCAWNAYAAPHPARPTRSKSSRNQTPTLKLKDIPHASATRAPHPKPCRTKLWAFHHGGTNRVTKGPSRHRTAYDTPCLQRTCSSCWTWHARLMGSVEPISPAVDPRILDGTWRACRSRRGSGEGVLEEALESAAAEGIRTPVLTPVEKGVAHSCEDVPRGEVVDALQSPALCDYDVFQPTSLVEQAGFTAPAKTEWRNSPEDGWTTCLKFVSREGKLKFREWVQRREKKERKRRYDREYRARLKGKKGGEGKRRGDVMGERRYWN
jgi:hypothetical protein